MPRLTRILLPLLVLAACLATRVAHAAAAVHRQPARHARLVLEIHPRERSHALRRDGQLVARWARLAVLSRERARIVTYARRFLGVPYAYGGTSPSGFDCSGFTRYVFAHFGISLPHYTFAQYDLGRRIARSALLPGDLVFFDGVGHVGLYIGHDLFIHAPHSGTRVTVNSLSGPYGASFVGARRVL